MMLRDCERIHVIRMRKTSSASDLENKERKMRIAYKADMEIILGLTTPT
ncbi:MAG: hypothetical protein QXV88_01800 [Candidatus Bathyarchaeia archaeon]